MPDFDDYWQPCPKNYMEKLLLFTQILAHRLAYMCNFDSHFLIYNLGTSEWLIKKL